MRAQSRGNAGSELTQFAAPEAEISVLGALMLNAETMDAVLAEGLSAEDFSSIAHRKIFEAACRLIDGGGEADTVTLRNELGARGELEAVGGVAYLAMLEESVPAAASAPHYARIIVDKARARRLYESALTAMGHLRDGQGMESAQAALAAGIEQSVGMGAVTTGYIGEILRAQLTAPAAAMTPFGLEALDRETGGLAEGVLSVVGAYPGTGKTTFATTALMRMAKADTPCALFSLEMSRSQVAQAVLAREAGIPVWRLRRAQKEPLGERDVARRDEVIAGLLGVPLLIDEKAGCSAEIAAKARLMMRKNGVKIIAVDYLQLLSPNQREQDRRREIDAHVQTFKRLARDTGLSVMLLSQLARPAASGQRGGSPNNNPKPSVHCLKESGGIYEAADQALLLWRPRFQEFELCGECGGAGETVRACQRCHGRGKISTDNEIQVIIGKDRFGEAGYAVALDWCGAFMQISSRTPSTTQASAF